MKRIILLRHGLIDCDNQTLNCHGQKLAKNLTDLFNDFSIECIISDIKQRCQETVLPLSNSLGLKIETFEKNDFSDSKVLNLALKFETTLICYRIESVNTLLTQMKLSLSTEENRNSAYEKLLIIKLCGNKFYIEDILETGCKKTD